MQYPEKMNQLILIDKETASVSSVSQLAVNKDKCDKDGFLYICDHSNKRLVVY